MMTPLPDDPARWQTVKALFEEAVARPPDERGAYLDETCRGDDALRRAVEALLQADGADDAFLDSTPASFLGGFPALMAAAPHPGGAEIEPGHLVGAYRVVRRLGAGGMGEVFLAERADGLFEQRVALKLVKRGMDTDAVLRRFAAERRILARLGHPGIAQLFAGGATHDGRPWFAMEYVEGVPLTRYVRERGLGLDSRLDLFEQVCEAVRHAHARLVVHRDLKPSNVLVAEGDGGEPVVKLLDFGIARLLDDDERSVLTRTGAQPMTRAYAAPEQVRGEAATTATDVYALGVLLYELLAGRRPFAGTSSPALLEAAILNEEPAPPSRHATESGLASAQLRGDLDTIVNKALRKGPEARYAGADALLDDIRRHRSGLPLAARPRSVRYRAQLFVRRHPTGVAVTAAVGLLLFAGSLFYTARVTAERDRAEQAAARAESTSSFLATLFERVDPTVARGDTLSALELLDHGLARLEADLAGAPLVQADLLDVMSEAYLRLDDAEGAHALAARALTLRRAHPDPQDPAGPARSLLRLAEAERDLVRFPQADARYREAVALLRTHDDTAALIEALQAHGWFLTSSSYRHDAIGPIYDEVLALRRAHYGDDDPGLGLALYQLASAQHLLGQYARADTLYRRAIASFRHHAEHPAELADALYVLGLVLFYQDRFAASDSMLTEALALHQQTFGAVHTETASVLGALGSTRGALGHLDEAETLLDSALAVFEQTEGPHGRGGVRTLSRLRLLHAKAGRYGEALSVARRLRASALALYGASGPTFAGYSGQYATALVEAGRPAEAEAHLRREVLPLLAEAHGTQSAMYGLGRASLAHAVGEQGRSREAEGLFDEAYATLALTLPAGNDRRGSVATALGALRAGRGAHLQALPLLQEGVATIQPGLPPPRAARRYLLLGESLLALGRLEEAERTLTEALARSTQALGPDHADTRAAARALARCRTRLADDT